MFSREAVERMAMAQVEAMRRADPERFSAAVRELSSLDRMSMVARLRGIAKANGVDLDMMAARLGVRL